MDAALANGVEYGLEPVLLGASVHSRAVLGSLAESIPDRVIQLLVDAAPDAWDDVDRLEYVQDTIILVYYGDTADVAFHHELDGLEHGAPHGSGGEVGVGAQVELTDCLLQEDGIVLVVDSDELEDAVLGYDGHHPLSARLVVDVDQRNPPCPGAQHARDGIKERERRVNGDGLDGDGAYGFLDVCKIIWSAGIARMGGFALDAPRRLLSLN